MPGILNKLRRRIDGLPRTPREIERSLTALSSLRGMGWQKSIRCGPVDAAGHPIPWITYPAIDWIEKRLASNQRIFEYGSGHSTLWYARHVSEVIAVEDNASWADKIGRRLPSNATVLYRSDLSSYVEAIADHEAGSFDVISIDGAARSLCSRVAPRYLKETGFIVFDNSDRPDCAEGVNHLMDLGYDRIDFVGFIPSFGHLGCTSIFLRDRSLLRPKVCPPFLGY